MTAFPLMYRKPFEIYYKKKLALLSERKNGNATNYEDQRRDLPVLVLGVGGQRFP